MKYFSRDVNHGKGWPRVICFQPQLLEKLSSVLENSAVSLVNCQVRGGHGGISEVVFIKSLKKET